MIIPHIKTERDKNIYMNIEMTGVADKPLLEVNNLRVGFRNKGEKIIYAVDGVDLKINPGEIHGLVGESGSGKTVTALSLLRLINRPGFIPDGEIKWNGMDLLKLNNNRL